MKAGIGNALAASRLPAIPSRLLDLMFVKPKWPVHADHISACRILNTAIDTDTPWVAKIESPAYKNMSKAPLEAGIQHGEEIPSGIVDLAELSNHSLILQGKNEGGQGKMSTDEVRAGINEPRKRKAGHEDISIFLKKSRRADDSARVHSMADSKPDLSNNVPGNSNTSDLLAKIANSSQTPFQKRVLSALMLVPAGQYTTYGILAKHLRSSARAVGNGLRSNPFAPQVPCHRVLASGGGIGGFKGSWGRNGKEGLNDGEKRRLLREEGVRFDGLGRVVGRPWDGFR